MKKSPWWAALVEAGARDYVPEVPAIVTYLRDVA